MKRNIYLILLILAILGLVSCVFASCKKSSLSDPLLNVRQFQLHDFGNNACYYVNGGTKNYYNSSTGYTPINKGDILTMCVDTIQLGCKLEFQIFDGHNKLLLDQDSGVLHIPQNISYTVK